MLRFLAFVYDPDVRDQRERYREAVDDLIAASQHDWRTVYESSSLAVWFFGDDNVAADPETMAAHAGVALGRMFVASEAADISTVGGLISRSFAAAVCASEGRLLGSGYWGSYIAFLHDPVSGRNCVARDPTGAIPCFHLDYGGIRLFFSDVADVRHSRRLSFKINSEFLKAEILLPGLQKTITALEGMEEVLPGEFWTGQGQENRSFIWNPYDVVRQPMIDDVAQAAALLRKATERTVWSLASRFSRITHNIGGLDSSIIYSCLARAPSRPQLSLINCYTDSPRGDERHYVRDMASRHGAPLIEVRLDHRSVDLAYVADMSNQAAPPRYFDCIDLAASLYDLDEVRQADALFYGVGGDNVFLQAAGIFPALDHVHAHGFSAGLLRVVANTMRDSRRSAWQIARAALRERFAPDSAVDHVCRYFFSGTTQAGYHPAILEEGPRFDLVHPLLLPPDGIAKGKFLQVLTSCFSPVEYYDQFFGREQVERVHVFYSQPIVEACLRIPSWLLAFRGIERGLARYAFRDDLAPSVMRRLTKGTPDEVYERLVTENRALLRDFLIDGQLVKFDILCSRAIEALMSDDGLETGVTPKHILDLFSREMWARNWASA